MSQEDAPLISPASEADRSRTTVRRVAATTLTLGLLFAIVGARRSFSSSSTPALRASSYDDDCHSGNANIECFSDAPTLFPTTMPTPRPTHGAPSPEPSAKPTPTPIPTHSVPTSFPTVPKTPKPTTKPTAKP